jgi:hypothetical protein
VEVKKVTASYKVAGKIENLLVDKSSGAHTLMSLASILPASSFTKKRRPPQLKADN